MAQLNSRKWFENISSGAVAAGDGDRFVVIPLVGRDLENLLRLRRGHPDLYVPIPGKPDAWPSLLRRAQDGVAAGDEPTVRLKFSDVAKGCRYWTTGTDGIVGKGGWQKSWPMRSIKTWCRANGIELLSVAPMFADVDDIVAAALPPRDPPPLPLIAAATEPEYFFYVKRFKNNDERVKIGYGKKTYAMRTSGTDNPGSFDDLLVERCSSRDDARALKRMFRTTFGDFRLKGDVYYLHPKVMRWVLARKEK